MRSLPELDCRRSPPRAPGFAWVELVIAVSIIGVSAFGIVWLLGAPERNKRAAAEKIVLAIADANQKRHARGMKFVTGRIDALSPLVVEGALPQQNWDNLFYSFSGAENAGDPCILASAARKTEGPKGTSKSPYAAWGVCASAMGDVQRFTAACALTCVKEAPPPVEKPAAPPPQARPAPEVPRPAPRPKLSTHLTSQPMRMDSKESIAPAVPDLGADQPEKPAASAGCSSTGCGGTDCCDPDSDRCVACPGGSCCQRNDVCKGTCFKDEECSQGCHCEHRGDQSWGSCRVGSFN